LAPALPWIAKGAGILGGALFGKKQQQQAQKRSPEEAAALTGAQGAAGTLGATGAGLTAAGQATQAPATGYYGKLLGGNRALQSQAVAAPSAAVRDVYSGAERNLERSGVRGAARDVASAELGRERAGKIAGLVTGVQPAAAEALTGIGQTQTQQGIGAAGQAGSIYSGLLGQGAQRTEYARGEGEKAGKGVGGFLFDLLSGFKGKGKKPGAGGVLPSRQTTPNWTSWMPGG
jgi:hypothetical protein